MYAITGTDPATGFASLLKSTDGGTTFGPRITTPFSDAARVVVQPNYLDPSGDTDTPFCWLGLSVSRSTVPVPSDACQ